MNRDLGMLARQVRHELAALRRSPIVLILGIAFPLVFFVLVAAVVGNETIDARVRRSGSPSSWRRPSPRSAW